MTLPIDMSEEQLPEVPHAPLGQTTSYGTAAYTDELNRRNVDKQTRELLALTADIRALTREWRSVARLASMLPLQRSSSPSSRWSR